MKYTLFLLIFCTNAIQAQYLSKHKTTLFGTSYHIDEEKVSKGDFVKQLESVQASLKLYRESKKLKKIGVLFNIGQWAMVGLQINEAFDNDDDFGYRYLVANVLMAVGTIYFNDKSNSFFRQSIGVYNRKKMNIDLSFLEHSNRIIGVCIGLN